MIDGGIVTNNPTLVGYAQAKKVFPNDSNLYSLEEHESSKIKNFKSKD